MTDDPFSVLDDRPRWGKVLLLMIGLVPAIVAGTLLFLDIFVGIGS